MNCMDVSVVGHMPNVKGLWESIAGMASWSLPLVQDLYEKDGTTHCYCYTCSNLPLVTESSDLNSLASLFFHCPRADGNHIETCLVPVYYQLRKNFVFMCFLHYLSQIAFLKDLELSSPSYNLDLVLPQCLTRFILAIYDFPQL